MRRFRRQPLNHESTEATELEAKNLIEPVWTPAPERVALANMTAFLKAVGKQSYSDAYSWSVAHPEEFWPSMWEFAGLVGDRSGEVAVGLGRMAPPDQVLGPRWFPGA